MSYSKLFFAKELEELNYEDIQNYFIDDKEESNKIEFKSYFDSEEKNFKDKENSVIRTICGLLNSEGGLIIWGAPVATVLSGKSRKIFQGGLSLVEKLIEKDTFINRVSDLITPSPKNIFFQRIEMKGAFIYLIEVGKSSYSPHQFRNIYYMRIDGQTRPAPHYFIEALFRKVSFPKLEGYIKIDRINVRHNEYFVDFSYLIFNQSRLQNEHSIYARILISNGRFSYMNPHPVKHFNTSRDLINQEVTKILFFNQPSVNGETFSVSTNEISQKDFDFTLLFFFGGKNSPLMVSTYKLSFNTVNLSEPNSIITQMEENVYSYENSDKINKSEEEKMRLILKR